MNTPTPAPAPLLLDKDGVAAMLTVSADTVLNLHRVRALPGVLVGKHLRWRPADVVAYVEKLGGDQ